jgi:hypothetical protein
VYEKIEKSRKHQENIKKTSRKHQEKRETSRKHQENIKKTSRKHQDTQILNFQNFQ